MLRPYLDDDCAEKDVESDLFVHRRHVKACAWKQADRYGRVKYTRLGTALRDGNAFKWHDKGAAWVLRAAFIELMQDGWLRKVKGKGMYQIASHPAVQESVRPVQVNNDDLPTWD